MEVPAELQREIGWLQTNITLTPSMKLKRRVVGARYANEITDFYADEARAKA